MPRISIEVSPTNRAISFPNGTTLESISAYGSATQFTPPAPGLRSAELPSEIDTSPLFEQALAETGIYEQETIHLEALPEAALRSGSAEDTLLLRPSIPAGDTDQRVVLYEDDSGGLSWHFAEGSRFTAQERERMERRGLLRDSGTPTFRIPARTTAARGSLTNGPPKGALRGFITKIGRKVLKVLVIPAAAKVLGKPVDLLAGAIEARVRQNRVWQLTPDNYANGPERDFTDWKSLDGKPTLLVVHGIFSSVEGMLNKLPRSVMERWAHHYEGRTIGFNHLSVTLSPEDNARFFLETARRAVPDGNFQFDIVCHSRGGIVSRTLAEHGHTVFADTNSTFRKVYFAAAPNKGSALGDPAHMLDMIDVFTNALTQFPDGHVLYAIETVLGVVKLMAYTAGVSLPGMASMSPAPDGYIAKVLNQGSAKSPAQYAGAGSDYAPRSGVDNGFFTGPFTTDIMDRIFVDHGHAVANDLVVPKDGVFAGNGHPSFPILNPLVYAGDDAVWHGGFFAETRTIVHIEKLLEIENGEPYILLDQVVAAGGKPEKRGSLELRGRVPELRGDDAGAPPILRPTIVERQPTIDFHEVVKEGEPNQLVVRLSEIQDSVEIDNLLAIEFAAGTEQIELTVELSAPGFTVDNRTAPMLIKRTRDAEAEKAAFILIAKSPGAKPVARTIVASFFRGGDCIGAVTHVTEVIPAGYTGQFESRGESTFDRVVISSQQRAEADLIIIVREDTSKPDTFEIALKSNILGEEYAMRDKGILSLQGSDFSDFFSKVIDPKFQSFPRDPKLSDAEFDMALATWSADFLTTLDRLGRLLWTLLPQEFRDEYLRLLALPTPPRSVCIYSDEMVLPWELVLPSGTVGGKFQEYPRLGVLHVIARWKPELGARPQPQALRIEKMTLLTPAYEGKPLYWADKESEELVKLIQAIEKPALVDEKTVEALLDGDGVQIVHFNGHGTWDSTGDLTALGLSNKESIPALAFKGRRLGMTAHPILYLNACSVGRGSMNLGRPGGFAANCLDSGWSGVIAPYWSVYDPQAMEFGVKLYRKLKSGISIGEALQQIRRDEPKNFTAQSYAYFGDPHARVLLQ